MPEAPPLKDHSILSIKDLQVSYEAKGLIPKDKIISSC